MLWLLTSSLHFLIVFIYFSFSFRQFSCYVLSSVPCSQVSYKKDAKASLHYTTVADRPDIKKATQAAKLISHVIRRHMHETQLDLKPQWDIGRCRHVCSGHYYDMKSLHQNDDTKKLKLWDKKLKLLEKSWNYERKDWNHSMSCWLIQI